MSIDNEHDLEDMNLALYEEEVLMTSLEPGPRIFTLANEKATTLLGFVLSETDDSFLVALPSRLIEDNGVKSIQTFIDAPFCRLLKTAVSMVIPIFGEFKEHFDTYISEKGVDRYPDMAEDIEVYLSSIEPELVKEVLSEEQVEARQKEIKELAEKIAEANSKGAVITDPGSTKH